MALIGTLNVGMKASTARFAKDMKAAKAVTRDFTSGIFSLKNAVIGLGTTLAASAVVGKFMDSMERLDALKKFADLLGADAQALQVFEIEGRKAGISGEALQKAIKKMTEATGEAMEGTGAASEAYKILGLDLREMFKLSPDQQFLKIGEAMKRVDNSTARLNAGIAIFGARGAQAVELAEAMATRFDDAKKSADGLGQSFSAVKLTRLEEANDAITDMQKRIGGVIDEISIGLSPFITLAAEKFMAWTATFSIMDEMKNRIGLVTDAINIMATTALTIQSAFEMMASGLGQMTGALAEFIAQDRKRAAINSPFLSDKQKQEIIDSSEVGAAFGETLRKESEKIGEQAFKTFDAAAENAAFGDIGKNITDQLMSAAKKVTDEADARAKKLVDAREARNAAGRTDEAFAKQQAAILEAKGKTVDVGGFLLDFWKDAIGGGAKMLGGHVDSIIDGLMFKEERKAPTLAQEFNSALVDIAALSTVGGAKDPQLAIAEKQLEELKKITKNPVEFIAKMVK